MSLSPSILPRRDLLEIPTRVGYIEALNRFHEQETALARWLLLVSRPTVEGEEEIFRTVSKLATSYRTAIEEDSLSLDKVIFLSEGKELYEIAQEQGLTSNDKLAELKNALRTFSECAIELSILTYRYRALARPDSSDG